jgi:hypothetical protein
MPASTSDDMRCTRVHSSRAGIVNSPRCPKRARYHSLALSALRSSASLSAAPVRIRPTDQLCHALGSLTDSHEGIFTSDGAERTKMPYALLTSERGYDPWYAVASIGLVLRPRD